MLAPLIKRLSGGVRSKQSRAAFERVMSGANGGPCLSIGGGPHRAHPRLVNLNIAAGENVDIVADAHRLPFADGTVAAAHSEAVFEHLRDPAAAARELTRVLKPGGMAFICTPFMQAFHGHPSHYQNFTLAGHKTLFETAGLEVLEQGVAMGPSYALCTLGWVYLREYAPRVLRPVLMALWAGVSLAVIQLDRPLLRRSNAHVLASATYLVAQKR
jgi:SAM-dependent methyltransferase